jgi:phenylacetate-coenzyme A ligase PaaK-like adenylate-forming protein
MTIAQFGQLASTQKYRHMSAGARRSLQEKRLRRLVGYARANSPYFNRLYSGIGGDFALRELPATCKADMMANFDDYFTDRDVRMSEIQEFIGDFRNLGRLYLDKYLIFTTSGSTGKSAVILFDRLSRQVMDAINACRAMRAKRDIVKFLSLGGRKAGIYASGGFYMGNGIYAHALRQNPRKGSREIIVDAFEPMAKIIAELNGFQPNIITGYPTTLSILADAQKRGALRISPILVLSSGEYLDDGARRQIEEAFGCFVQNSYISSEGGMIGCECGHRHMHLNDDWVIAEPVDAGNNPVRRGEPADKWLMTNLASYAQPFIRYEVTDRIVVHEEACPCGARSPWIEIEGRTDDILSFESEQGTVKISPVPLSMALKEQRSIDRFQIRVHRGNRIELLISAADRKAAFADACAVLDKYLKENGIASVFSLSEELPRHNAKSGKYKYVYNVD